jgi:hypothetical protein
LSIQDFTQLIQVSVGITEVACFEAAISPKPGVLSNDFSEQRKNSHEVFNKSVTCMLGILRAVKSSKRWHHAEFKSR